MMKISREGVWHWSFSYDSAVNVYYLSLDQLTFQRICSKSAGKSRLKSIVHLTAGHGWSASFKCWFSSKMYGSQITKVVCFKFKSAQYLTFTIYLVLNNMKKKVGRLSSEWLTFCHHHHCCHHHHNHNYR